MTSVEKRKLLEFISRCIRYDLLSDADVNSILKICSSALDREFKKSEEGEMRQKPTCHSV